jgi:RNA polymerase sigma factor (sigma-70 family)
MTSYVTTRLPVREPIAESSRADIEPPTDHRVSQTEWLAEILEQFEGPLLRYAHRITGDMESARDAVQETLLRACREDRSALEGHLAQWLFRVCRSRALDAQRKERRMFLATDQGLQIAAGEDGPPELLAARETSSQLFELLDNLPANQQEVIRLKFQNDLSYREIADVTGLSISNVGFLLHTGLKRLRELMKDE